MQIPFNKPYLTGKEAHYLYQAVYSGHISGNGQFTKKCQQFFQERYGFEKCLLTTSCTAALEMAAILIDTRPGDEIIMPSYTFVSTANAFVLRGAKIVFVDSRKEHPNLEPEQIEPLVTERTKAIVPVHYAGVACDMDKIVALAEKYRLFVIEDAAQAIDSFYQKRPLGGIGHLAAFSFHETKNIMAGEGGMLVINDDRFAKRAEIIWEKGTNRAAFFRGEIDKYGWVDVGSSFLPSDIIAAFLYAQVEHLDDIQCKRQNIWRHYHEGLMPLAEKGFIQLPQVPEFATNNAHIFYLLCRDAHERDELLAYLKSHGIGAVFHYLALHQSAYYAPRHDGRLLPMSEFFSDCLLRLPLYYELTADEVAYVNARILEFFQQLKE